MQQINKLRDAELAGEAQAGKKFNSAHRFSVVVNALQLLLTV
jgi:hypothetical protein